jgi:hypothetical protein
MTLALRPARRYVVSNRRHAARQKDITRRVRVLTRLLSVAVGGLLVWIVILGVSLPATLTSRQWRLLWIGFDTAEVAALGVTLWAVYRSRQLAIPAALITGTLFACDAWVDVVLSWGTRGWWFSLATAVLVELPLAALLWGSARSMVHAVIAHQIPQTLQSTNGPHLRQLELLPHEHPNGESVRSAVVVEARSGMRREDVGDGSAAEWGRADRLDGEGCGEEPLAGTQDDGVGDKAVLIDQAGLDQRSGEPCTALSK